MPIDFVCEDCPQRYRVPDSAAGKTLTCKRCGKELVVPVIESSEAMPWTAMPTTDDAIEVETLLSPTKSRDPNSKAPEPASESSRSTTAARQVSSARQDLGAGVYLEGFEDGWRLVASTRDWGCIVGCLMTFIMLSLMAFVSGGDLFSGSHRSASPGMWFILPFFVIALPVLVLCLSRFFARRIEITVQGEQGTLFSGLVDSSPLQHFRWTEFTKISHEFTKRRGGDLYEIVLSGDPFARTGRYLTREQAMVMSRALGQLKPLPENGTETWLSEHLGHE